MNIAILGTRGVPNHYGGFEQFAEYLSLGLVQRGHQVTVYNSHNHPYQNSSWNGVTISHQYDPEFKLGTAGQFIYDLNCILHSRRQNFDIILQLGYTSSSVWSSLFPKKALIITNMDGLEWKRSKYNAATRKFLKFAEKLAVQKSDFLIADSIGIQEYLKASYDVPSEYIAYGATLFKNPSPAFLGNYQLEPYGYNLLIARLEPENSIEIILQGMRQSSTSRPLLVVGGLNTPLAKKLLDTYQLPNIRFLGAIYDIQVLNNLRAYSNLYFHGHTVGGTNPSLLEAMASDSLICAHHNAFNEHILGPDAFYFKEPDQVKDLLDHFSKTGANLEKVANNRQKIAHAFSWDKIIGQYEDFFQWCLSRGKRGYSNGFN